MLVLGDATPQRDASENTRNGCRLVASAEIGPERCRFARRVDAAGAFEVGRHVFAEVAPGHEVGSARPRGIVDDRCEPQPARCFPYAPHTPALGVVDDP